MNYKLSDLNGIDQDQVAKLRESGIETTNDLMHVWNDEARRIQVATRAGISDAELTHMISMARMARMKGVGPKYVGLLVAAGVTGLRSLSKHTPQTLVKHLGEVSLATNHKGPVPTLVEVGIWFAELRPIVTPDEKIPGEVANGILNAIFGTHSSPDTDLEKSAVESEFFLEAQLVDVADRQVLWHNSVSYQKRVQEDGGAFDPKKGKGLRAWCERLMEPLLQAQPPRRW